MTVQSTLLIWYRDMTCFMHKSSDKSDYQDLEPEAAYEAHAVTDLPYGTTASITFMLQMLLMSASLNSLQGEAVRIMLS